MSSDGSIRGAESAATPLFDHVIHAPHRLRICAFLDGIDSAEFAALRDDLDITDAMLSKHLAVLRDHGYVSLEKPRGQGRVRTWARMTPAGRSAYRRHVAALHELVGRTVPTGS